MKNLKVKKSLILLPWFLESCLICAAALAQEQVVSLGTGGVTGVYYPTGRWICRVVNKFREKHGLRCVLEATSGSVANISCLKDNSLDLGIAQSNWIYQRYNADNKNTPNQAFLRGLNRQQKTPQLSSLRTLLVLYPEYFTVIVPKNSTIRSLDDIRGKRISIGTVGSSLRATMNDLLIKKGRKKEDFSKVIALGAAEQASALCDGEIDVMIYTVGHPSGAAREATQDCESRLIAIQGPAIEQLLKENAYYRWAKIPGSLYRGNIKSIPTFGVNAIFYQRTVTRRSCLCPSKDSFRAIG